jgi:glycosyltransferase involved in cell wall biosynthesis
MKIAFIGQKGIPFTFGGIECHVDQLSRGLVRRSHESAVYVRNWYTDKKLKNYEGVSLIHIPTLKTKHLDASVHSLLSSLHAVIAGFDIIHYHGIGPSFFSFIPRLFGKKIVATVHRLDWATEKWGKFAKALLKTGEYVSVKIPHQTIVVSKDLKRYFKDKYNQEVIYIPNGVELPVQLAGKLIKERYNLEGRDYILFMGRLVPEKRVDWLVESFLSLAMSSPELKDVKLVIAGESSGTDKYVRRLKELGRRSEKIIFCGYTEGREKAEFFSNALLLVLPSYLEGFPIVVLEAKSYGVCVLASNISPHRELIENDVDGVLFETDNFSDLTAKIQNLLHDPQKIVAIGKKAQESMKKNMSWNEVVRKSLDVYTSVLKR